MGKYAVAGFFSHAQTTCFLLWYEMLLKRSIHAFLLGAQDLGMLSSRARFSALLTSWGMRSGNRAGACQNRQSPLPPLAPVPPMYPAAPSETTLGRENTANVLNRSSRFGCCARVYPCDRCHDEKEEHPNEHASRMIW